MTRRKFENFETSKYKNENLSKFMKKRQISPLPPLQNFTQCFVKTHKMTRRKIENFKTSK
jgi:hypothetical protein